MWARVAAGAVDANGARGGRGGGEHDEGQLDADKRIEIRLAECRIFPPPIPRVDRRARHGDRRDRSEQQGDAGRPDGVGLPAARIGQALIEKDRSQPPAHRFRPSRGTAASERGSAAAGDPPPGPSLTHRRADGHHGQ